MRTLYGSRSGAAQVHCAPILRTACPTCPITGENFWYLELGGDARLHTRHRNRCDDELLKTAYGIWDYVKNAPENKEKNANWRLDWMGILPGKRESRRYVGDYIMTQHDVRAEGRFDDLIAYGGWSMDDHHPSGFRTTERPTIFHPAPSPYRNTLPQHVFAQYRKSDVRRA